MRVEDEQPEFTVVRWRAAYAVAAVDDFVEQARAALEYDPPLMGPDGAENARFPVVRTRGYATAEVDAYLDRVADELRRREPDDPQDR